MIYAGQERGNETYRGPIRWHDGDNDLTDFHRDLAALREREPLLREGAVDCDGPAADVRVVDGDAERVTAYVRAPEAGGVSGEAGGDGAETDAEGAETDGEGNGADAEGADDDDPLLVVVNFASEPVTVAVPEGVETDLFGDRAVGGQVDVDAVAVLR
jgi:pullulanase/glycogen debranching enzyme